MKKQIFAIFLCFSSLFSFAQKETVVKLKNVRGEFALTANVDMTIKEAQEMAREAAKRKAIEQVCGQRVNIWDKVDISAAGESFNSLSIVQTDGYVSKFEEVQLGQENSAVRNSELIFYCVADIEVTKGMQPDMNFSAKVDGIRSVYLENDNLNFSVLPLQDCYLKIFLFENSEKGYLLYPNVNEKTHLFKAQQKVAFPLVDEYIITKETQANKETNTLVFVFTKSEWNFFQEETSRSQIEKWMMKIPTDQKYIYMSVFDIRSK